MSEKRGSVLKIGKGVFLSLPSQEKFWFGMKRSHLRESKYVVSSWYHTPSKGKARQDDCDNFYCHGLEGGVKTRMAGPLFSPKSKRGRNGIFTTRATLFT